MVILPASLVPLVIDKDVDATNVRVKLISTDCTQIVRNLRHHQHLIGLDIVGVRVVLIQSFCAEAMVKGRIEEVL